MKRPLIRHSPPSPASTGCTLLRTSAPPSSTECDTTLALLPCWMRSVEMLKSLLVLALDHVVRKHSVVAGDQFRDRVAERHTAVERHIVLDERGLAVFLRHNEVARMAHGWGIAADIKVSAELWFNRSGIA